MVDSDNDRPGMMPAIHAEQCVPRRSHDPADVGGANDQDRDRAQPAFHFLADEVERREHLRRRRRNAQVLELFAEQGGAMARAIRCEDDPEALLPELGDQFGGAGQKPRPFPDRPIKIKRETSADPPVI